MASKLKGVRLEAEVEKCRAEQNWEKLQELLPLILSSGSGLQGISNLLLGETYLEKFIDQHAACPKPDASYREELKKAQKYLKLASESNDMKKPLVLETKLLLAKLHFICAQYDQAIECLEDAGIDTGSIEYSSLRTLRLVCEAYAIKGYCLDKNPPKSTSKFKKAQREEDILKAFEKCAELAVLYLQELDRNTQNALQSLNATTPMDKNTLSTSADVRIQIPSTTISKQDRLGDLVETALQRVPIYYIQHKMVDKGVNSYRKLLPDLDHRSAQTVQQNLTRQLAEVILRGIPPKLYFPPVAGQEKERNMVQFYIHDSAFCPKNRHEEMLLLLLLSDSIACRDAVLSRADEFQSTRKESLLQVKAVHNLLTIVLSCLRQYDFLSEIWERAMKFAYDDAYIWKQFALTLLCQGWFARSAFILKECQKEKQPDTMALLFLSKLSIEHLGHYEEGIAFAKKALKTNGHEWLHGRCHLLAGLGYSLLSNSMPSYTETLVHEKNAIGQFQEAVGLDPKDHVAWFYLALQFAIGRNVESAKEYCQKALSLCPEHVPSILLLALLLTTDQSFDEALELVQEGLENHPNHFGLIVLRMKLEMSLGMSVEALLSAKDLLMFWKREANSSPSQVNVKSQENEQSVLNERISAAISPLAGFPPTPAVPSPHVMDYDRDSIVGSLTVGGPVSEFPAASTFSDSMGVTGSSQHRSILAIWRLQANAWLELGEMFLQAGRVKEVESCVEEAVGSFPSSHQALYLRGRVFQLDGRLEGAKHSFLGALSVCPNHIPALRHLALVYVTEGNFKLAEKVLRDLVKVYPLDHNSWQALGCVLAEIDQVEQAEKCFVTATKLEQSAPLLPYFVIPRVLHL